MPTTDPAQWMSEHVDDFAHISTRFPYSLPTEALRFPSLSLLRRAVSESGSKFFHPNTLRFFSSRILPTLYGNRFFITSEQDKDSGAPRLFTVRYVYRVPSSDMLQVETLGTFQQGTSLDAARFLAKEAASVLPLSDSVTAS